MKTRWFDSILNAGVKPDLDAFDANCIRAMNRFGFYGTILSCIGISYGFFLEDTSSSYLGILIFPALVSILLSSHFQRNLLAIFFGFARIKFEATLNARADLCKSCSSIIGAISV